MGLVPILAIVLVLRDTLPTLVLLALPKYVLPARTDFSKIFKRIVWVSNITMLFGILFDWTSLSSRLFHLRIETRNQQYCDMHFLRQRPQSVKWRIP